MMTDKPNAGSAKGPDSSDTQAKGSAGLPAEKASVADFASAYSELKCSIIRPAFEKAGTRLKTIGYDIGISETPDGKISIHIVPPGVNKSIHAYDWFPTLSFFARR
jgi:hypothetical protein